MILNFIKTKFVFQDSTTVENNPWASIQTEGMGKDGRSRELHSTVKAHGPWEQTHASPEPRENLEAKKVSFLPPHVYRWLGNAISTLPSAWAVIFCCVWVPCLSSAEMTGYPERSTDLQGAITFHSLSSFYQLAGYRGWFSRLIGGVMVHKELPCLRLIVLQTINWGGDRA